MGNRYPERKLLFSEDSVQDTHIRDCIDVVLWFPVRLTVP